MTRLLSIWGLCFLACLSIQHLRGQAATATITGTVTDSSGAAIPGAAVNAKNNGTGLTRSTTSDAQGRYNLPDLAIGDYDVQATKMGFQTVVRKGVNLTVGSLPVADFQLPVGQAEQTINVEGPVSRWRRRHRLFPPWSIKSQMRELPLNGRNFEQLILLAPGAISYPAGGSSALVGRAATFSVSGARPEGHAILLDGENLQDWWQRGSGANVSGTSLGVEAIAEFQTLTNTYGAQYRRQRRGGQRGDQVGHQRFSRLGVRLPSQQRHGCAQLLRRSQARAPARPRLPQESIRRQRGRSREERQAILLRELRRNPPVAGWKLRWSRFRTPTPATDSCPAAWRQRSPATPTDLANVRRAGIAPAPGALSRSHHGTWQRTRQCDHGSATRSFTKTTVLARVDYTLSDKDSLVLPLRFRRRASRSSPPRSRCGR